MLYIIADSYEPEPEFQKSIPVPVNRNLNICNVNIDYDALPETFYATWCVIPLSCHAKCPAELVKVQTCPNMDFS